MHRNQNEHKSQVLHIFVVGCGGMLSPSVCSHFVKGRGQTRIRAFWSYWEGDRGSFAGDKGNGGGGDGDGGGGNGGGG